MADVSREHRPLAHGIHARFRERTQRERRDIAYRKEAIAAGHLQRRLDLDEAISVEGKRRRADPSRRRSAGHP
jgi:hypothetical protein